MIEHLKMSVKEFIDYINKTFLSEDKRSRVLLAEVLYRLERMEQKIDSLETKRKVKKVPSPYVIQESEKYDGCYNIYDRKTGDRVKYFAETDDKNKARAIEWVMSKSKIDFDKVENHPCGEWILPTKDCLHYWVSDGLGRTCTSCGKHQGK